MSADSIRMGRAHVEIGGDDSPLKRVLRSVGQQIQATGQRIRGIGASMLGAGLSGATALGGASLAFGAMGDDMAKMATPAPASSSARSAGSAGKAVAGAPNRTWAAVNPGHGLSFRTDLLIIVQQGLGLGSMPQG